MSYHDSVMADISFFGTSGGGYVHPQMGPGWGSLWTAPSQALDMTPVSSSGSNGTEGTTNPDGSEGGNP
jgi:hypothetical protein